jgi:hypothetical protein
MIEPTEADIGRDVIYRADSPLPGETETGVITSFNAHSVFVRYAGKRQSQGTSREDLTWEFPTSRQKDHSHE